MSRASGGSASCSRESVFNINMSYDWRSSTSVIGACRLWYARNFSSRSSTCFFSMKASSAHRWPWFAATAFPATSGRSGAACSCAVAGAGTAFCGADATGAMAAGGVVATGAVVGAACGCARVLPGAFDTGAGPAGVEVVADAPDATGVAGVTGVTGLLGASGVAGSGGTSETAESPLTVTPGGALAKGQVNRVGKTIRRVAPSSTAARIGVLLATAASMSCRSPIRTGG